MGRDLHISILRFIEDALNQHTMVASWERIDSLTEHNDYLYHIKRNKRLSDIIMHASDSYFYTLNNYFQKPDELSEGSFIYIARPEAKYNADIVEILQTDKISIGKFGALIGALYQKEHWNYIPKERREEETV